MFTGDPLHRWALDRRDAVTLDDGVVLQLAPLEYVIIRKLEFYREGNSDKHLRDVASMLRQSGEQVDQMFLDRELEQRGLLELLHAG